jgi:hypothetical protein
VAEPKFLTVPLQPTAGKRQVKIHRTTITVYCQRYRLLDITAPHRVRSVCAGDSISERALDRTNERAVRTAKRHLFGLTASAAPKAAAFG